MAAPIHDLSTRSRQFPEPLARFFAVPAVEDVPAVPRLRVIPGGREAALRHRRPGAIYRRRRAAAAATAAVLLFISVLAVGRLGEVVGAASMAEDPITQDDVGSRVGAAVGRAGLEPDSWVVQPGDTLWSIAAELRPEGDVRPLVDELARRSGGSALEVGQRLDVGGLRG